MPQPPAAELIWLDPPTSADRLTLGWRRCPTTVTCEALAGQGIGGEVLRWARIHAARHGDFFLRVAAWPTEPRLHTYLSARGLRYLTHTAGPLATSRALFVQPAFVDDGAGPFAGEPAPVLLVTRREDLEHPVVDHEHVAPQLLLGSGLPARLVPCHRYRLREAGGWRLQGAQAVRWHPGGPVTAVAGLELASGTEYVLTHLAGDPCGVEIVAVRRGHPGLPA